MPERRAAERARRLRAGRRGGWLLAAMAVAGLLASAGRGDRGTRCGRLLQRRQRTPHQRLLAADRDAGRDRQRARARLRHAGARLLSEGRYELALPDYDAAIKAQPDFAIALNNRAWALYKSGRAEAGLADVERALELSPHSPHALDTRAHIRQAGGESELALADYELAMRFGGEHMVKLYQCGLQAAGLYSGDVDGLYTRALRQALEACVASSACDPLPADEECRKATS